MPGAESVSLPREKVATSVVFLVIGLRICTTAVSAITLLYRIPVFVAVLLGFVALFILLKHFVYELSTQ